MQGKETQITKQLYKWKNNTYVNTICKRSRLKKGKKHEIRRKTNNCTILKRFNTQTMHSELAMNKRILLGHELNRLTKKLSFKSSTI